jgi:ArsR family transcriptional regulator, lead/cadmium/zinc/bismuth-responsive transcriptional repressor
MARLNLSEVETAAAAERAAGAAPQVDANEELCELKQADAAAVEEVRRTLVSDRAAAALAATFSVLGDPTRVRLLDALARRELCVCDLAELIGSSDSAVSHQLRLLRSLRLVRSRRSGRMMFYRLDDDHIRLLLDQSRRHIEETGA